MRIIHFLKTRLTRRGRTQAELTQVSPEDRTVFINGHQVQVGKFTYGVQNIELVHHENCPLLSIGRFCSIAGDVQIFLGAYHRSDWVSTYPFLSVYHPMFDKSRREGFPKSNGPVTIGNDVWIGNGVTIMSGVRIGDGAILAAGAHVINDVEPYAIVGGNPAKLIKHRFNQDICNELIRLQWWNWPLQTILKHQDMLSSNPILEHLKTLNSQGQQT
jgi:acetyltransferase-like isoleucine patch superfamily enzyme